MLLQLMRLSASLSWLSFGAIGLRAIIAALHEWQRKAELSGDRAGLLAAQDPGASLRMMMKLAGGGTLDDLDVTAFAQQGDEYLNSPDVRDSVLKLLMLEGRSHPFAVVRAAELRRWVDSGEYNRVLAGEYARVYDEIVAVKEACGETHLKVILETGELETYDNVRRASVLAMAAGADFIKTSTGKVQPASTLPVTLVMLEAIRDFYQQTGRAVGMKPAGGIRTAKEAISYLTVLYETLGPDWMTPAPSGSSLLSREDLPSSCELSSRWCSCVVTGRIIARSSSTCSVTVVAPCLAAM
jgi:hypothetical protein